MKYILYHAKEHLFRDSSFYRKDGAIFNKSQAIEAFEDLEYTKVHEFEIDDYHCKNVLEQIYHNSQNIDIQWKEETRSTSVGDIIETESGELYIVASCGFDKLR